MSIIHFASRGAMDIEGLGPSRVEELMSLGFISGVSSIYGLKDQRQQLAALKGWGEQSAANLISAIEATRGRAFDRFIFALGIPGVGQATARLLAQNFASLKELMAAKQTDLEKLETVGLRGGVQNYRVFCRAQKQGRGGFLNQQIKPAKAKGR
jgi:DNA ligase (NAD+)